MRSFVFADDVSTYSRVFIIVSTVGAYFDERWDLVGSIILVRGDAHGEPHEIGMVGHRFTGLWLFLLHKCAMEENGSERSSRTCFSATQYRSRMTSVVLHFDFFTWLKSKSSSSERYFS